MECGCLQYLGHVAASLLRRPFGCFSTIRVTLAPFKRSALGVKRGSNFWAHPTVFIQGCTARQLASPRFRVLRISMFVLHVMGRPIIELRYTTYIRTAKGNWTNAEMGNGMGSGTLAVRWIPRVDRTMKMIREQLIMLMTCDS
jgi:hypothetical protein